MGREKAGRRGFYPASYGRREVTGNDSCRFFPGTLSPNLHAISLTPRSRDGRWPFSKRFMSLIHMGRQLFYRTQAVTLELRVHRTGFTYICPDGGVFRIIALPGTTRLQRHTQRRLVVTVRAHERDGTRGLGSFGGVVVEDRPT